jgi:putative ABC transport system permease protein
VFIGLSLAYVASNFMKVSAFEIVISPVLSLNTILLAALLPLASNVLAAFIPARRGASLNPVEALRYE